LLLQSGEVEAEEILDVLVEGRVVVEFAIGAGDNGAPLSSNRGRIT
jgi:hypothetical protein